MDLVAIWLQLNCNSERSSLASEFRVHLTEFLGNRDERGMAKIFEKGAKAWKVISRTDIGYPASLETYLGNPGTQIHLCARHELPKQGRSSGNAMASGSRRDRREWTQ
jgi:hypothetical protein